MTSFVQNAFCARKESSEKSESETEKMREKKQEREREITIERNYQRKESPATMNAKDRQR